MGSKVYLGHLWKTCLIQRLAQNSCIKNDHWIKTVSKAQNVEINDLDWPPLSPGVWQCVYDIHLCPTVCLAFPSGSTGDGTVRERLSLTAPSQSSEPRRHLWWGKSSIRTILPRCCWQLSRDEEAAKTSSDIQVSCRLCPPKGFTLVRSLGWPPCSSCLFPFEFHSTAGESSG